MSGPAHKVSIVFAAANKIIPRAGVSCPVQLLGIVSWFDADLENKGKVNFCQLFLFGARYCLAWMDPFVDQKTHLNDEDDETSNVEKVEGFL